MELRNFFKKNNSKNTTKKEQDFYQKTPRKKFLKIFAAASLALITCATTLLATAPFGTGAASAATNSNLSNNTKTTSPLGLDPENDPVVFTTSSGIDIKYGGAGMPNGVIPEDVSTTRNLKGYAYVTMANTNWVIIGQSTNGFSSAFAVQAYANGWATSEYADITSAAGNAMYSDPNFLAFSEVYGDIPGTIAYTFPKVATSSELNQNELLCFSEVSIAAMSFGSKTSYIDSEIRQFLTDYYNNTFTSAEKRGIVKQTLQTCLKYNGTPSSHEDYIFLLAHYKLDSGSPNHDLQNFRINTYLTSDSLRKMTTGGLGTQSRWMYLYWLRSVSSSSVAWYVDSYGGPSYSAVSAGGSSCSGCANTSGYNYQVRPAFVLSLTQ